MQINDNLTDERLIERIKSGDTELFELLYDKYFTYLRKIVGDKLWSAKNSKPHLSWINIDCDSEDLTQEIITKSFKGLDRYDPSKSIFKTWLVTIAGNHVLDWLTKRRIPLSSPACDSEDDSVSTLIENIPEKKNDLFENYFLRDAVRDIIGTLFDIENELMKSYLISKFIFATSDGALAELYGVTESAVRSNICRAMKLFVNDFTSKKAQYSGIDKEGLANAIRTGVVHITEIQIENISDTAARKVVEALFIHKISVEKFSNKNKISKEEVHRLIKKGILEMLSGGLKRRFNEMKEIICELSEGEAKAVSEYISTVLGHKKVSATRASQMPDKLSQLKSSIDLLAAAAGTLLPQKTGIRSVGTMLHGVAKKKGISLNELSETLKLDINQLTEVLNNKFSDEMKSDKELLKRLSEFLGIPEYETKTLIDFARPPIRPGATTRGFDDMNSRYHTEAKKKISELLAKKYRKK